MSYLYCSKSLELAVLRRLFNLLLWKLQTPLGKHETGRNTVDSDLGSANDSQSFCEMNESGFGDGIRQRASTRLYTGYTGSCDKGTLCLF